MQIWTGLGNPGPRYAMQRHNVGFMALDVIADMYDFGPVQKKFSGWVQEGRIGSHKILLLKPATFMNESAGGLPNNQYSRIRAKPGHWPGRMSRRCRGKAVCA